MTSNSLFKQDVRLFADLNGISYTTALREFDATAGKPFFAARDRNAVGPNESAELAWANARGLVQGSRYVCFHQLANASGRVGADHSYTHRRHLCATQGDARFKDHPRSYLFRGPNDSRRRTAVLAFSPYQRWASETLRDELEEIVDEFDVRYRIGLTRDVTYGAGTVPIIFWNPRVIDLP
ncbi:MAG: hypothetical protein AB7H92_17420 [Microbacteriaceae bacterium]